MPEQYRMHIILDSKLKLMLDELAEDKALNASDVVRLLLAQEHKKMKRAQR